MSPTEINNPILWRRRGELLRLEGSMCPTCGEKIFPIKHFCPKCDYEIEGTLLGIGTVNMVLDQHSQNKKREAGFAVSIEDGKLKLNIYLNGKGHSLGFEAGMKINVFERKSSRGEEPQYDFKPIESSLTSK